MRILFVDNHPEFTATVTEAFLTAHDVVVIPTIEAAKAAIQTAAFDVVLVDYDLDDGKGDELVRWIRTTRAWLKLIAVSARDTGNESLIAAGVDAVCSKVGFAQIQSTLERVTRTEPRPRIYADFNGLMGSPREVTRSMVPLDTWGSLRDLSNAGVKLREGMKLVIHDPSDEIEDLQAEATAYYDPVRRWWFAELDHELAYVPAGDRSPITRFSCLGCRADLGAPADSAIVRERRTCPHCGLSLLAAIEPP